MAMRDHIEPADRAGVLITYVDPSRRVVNARNKQAGDITVPIASTPAFFRWPVVGEKWVVRRENGSWVLDGLWTDSSASTIKPEDASPGDVIIDSPTGMGWLGKTALGSSSFVNVKDPPYNAIGDGITDDSASVAAACLNPQGRTVYFPQGRYLVDPFSSPVSLCGVGHTAHLINRSTGPSADFVHLSGSHVTCSGLVIDGRRAALAFGAGGAIAVYKPAGACPGGLFAGGMTLSATAPAGATSISVVSATYGGVTLKPGEIISLVAGTTSEYAMVASSYVAGATTIPLYEPLKYTYNTSTNVSCCPTGVHVLDCVIYAVRRDGCYFWNPYGGSMAHNEVYDCVDTGLDLPNGGYGVTISDNRVYTNGRWGIGVDAGDLDVFVRNAFGNVIANNDITIVGGGSDPGGAAIDGVYIGRSLGTVVTGNTINLEKAGTPGLPSQSGINLVGAALQAVVSNNTILCSSTTNCHGIRYIVVAGQTQDIAPRISNNQITNADIGISLSQILAALVSDNTLYNCLTYGIDIERHATIAQVLLATGNHISGGVVGIRGGGLTGAPSIIKTGLNMIFNTSFAPIAVDPGWTLASISGFT